MFVWKYEHIDKSLWFCLIRLIGCSATATETKTSRRRRERIGRNPLEFCSDEKYHSILSVSRLVEWNCVICSYIFTVFDVTVNYSFTPFFFRRRSFVRLFVFGCRRSVLEFVRFQTNLHIKLTMTTNDQHGHWAVHSIHILHVILWIYYFWSLVWLRALALGTRSMAQHDGGGGDVLTFISVMCHCQVVDWMDNRISRKNFRPRATAMSRVVDEQKKATPIRLEFRNPNIASRATTWTKNVANRNCEPRKTIGYLYTPPSLQSAQHLFRFSRVS